MGSPQCASPAKDLCGCCHSCKGTLGLSVLDCRGILFPHRQGFPRLCWYLKEQEVHTGAFSPMMLCCKGLAGCTSPQATRFPVASDDTLPRSPSDSQPWGLFGLSHPASPKAHFFVPFLGARIWTGCGQDVSPGSTVLPPDSLLGCHLSEGRGHTIKPSLPQQLTHWGNWFYSSILQMKLRLRQVFIWQLSSGKSSPPPAHWRGFARILLSGSL